MHHRTLGRTGIEVSEIGYGAWGIGRTGWVGADDEESLRALRRAIELGLDFIDTALGYGDGHSEKLVGEVVRATDHPIAVATKIPPKNGTWPAAAGTPLHKAFPGKHVRKCTEKSLRNTGLDVLDVQQFHVWLDDWLGEGDWQETVQALKDEGKIRAFGVSINDHQPETALRAVRSGSVDTVQVIYNVFDQSPADGLLDACREHGVGVIVRVALDEGGLTGRITPDTEFPRRDFRRMYFGGDRKQQVVEHVTAICEDLGITTDELPEVALRFVLSHPAVSTVIPGMRTVRNVERNVAIGDGRGLPGEQRDKLLAHRWIRNFYRPA